MTLTLKVCFRNLKLYFPILIYLNCPYRVFMFIAVNLEPQSIQFVFVFQRASGLCLHTTTCRGLTVCRNIYCLTVT